MEVTSLNISCTALRLADDLSSLLEEAESAGLSCLKSWSGSWETPICSLLTGLKLSSLRDIRSSIPALVKLAEKPDQPVCWLASLAFYELILWLKYSLGKASVNPIPDEEARSYALKLVSGGASGVILVVGEQFEDLKKLLVKAQKLGFIVLVASPTYREILESEAIVDRRRGLISHVAESLFEGLIYGLSFLVRIALISGKARPGDLDSARKTFRENLNPILAILTGDVPREAVAGAITLGVPVFSTYTLLPSEVEGYFEVDSADRLLTEASRRLSLLVALEHELPVGFSEIYEGKSVRSRDVYVEFGGGVTPYFELVVSRSLDEVDEGSVEVIGVDLDEMPEHSFQPLGILVEVSGVRMKPEYEPILERSIHRIINYGEETWHVGQRDRGWVRITRRGFDRGLRLSHLGLMIYIGLKRLYGDIASKIQVKLYTDEAEVSRLLEYARRVYRERDARLIGLSDEDTGTFYICTVCQTFLPNHVCVITPERLGLCGTVSYLDAQVAYELKGEASGMKPVEKGRVLDPLRGEWENVDRTVAQLTHGAVNKVCLYSLTLNPTTSTLSFDCISVFIPECNGIMVVDSGYRGETPIGLDFNSLAGMISGVQMPGFLGHSRRWILSRKYFKAEGGLKRIVWMPRTLKEALGEELEARCREEGLPDLPSKIADETSVKSLDELLDWLTKVKHPVLKLPPILAF